MVKKIAASSTAIKSFQSLTVSEELLQNMVEAVTKGEREALASSTIQSFQPTAMGFRQLICLGTLYIVPPAVCDKKNEFPIALLYGTVVRELNFGEETADLVSMKIGQSEFDEYSQVDFKELKKRLFTGEDGKLTSLIIFAPSWANTRDYVCFKFVESEDKLKNLIRHLVFSAYFDPRLSSAFDALMTTVDTTKWDIADITPKLPFPALAENPLKQYPQLEKVASGKKVYLTRKNADEITQQQLDPQELNVFESLDSALTNVLMPETESAQDAAGEFKQPGAVTTAPEGDRQETPTEQQAEAQSDHTQAKQDPNAQVASKTARPYGYMDKPTPEGTRGTPCAKCNIPIKDGEVTNGSVSNESHISCPSAGSRVPQPTSFYGSKEAAVKPILTVLKEGGFTAKQVGKAWVYERAGEKVTFFGKDSGPRGSFEREGEEPILFDTDAELIDTLKIDTLGTPKAASSKRAALVGKTIKSASVKVTFGTNNVYFDMNGTKYMLEGPKAEAFINEWLPAYDKLRAGLEAGRQKLVDSLTQKYMGSMVRRPSTTKKAPTSAPVPAPEAEAAPAPEAMSATASADYIASILGADMDDDVPEAASSKTKAARAKREAELDKKYASRKKANVPLTEESIWKNLTKDFGEAPQVVVPGENSGKAFGEETKAPNFESKAPAESPAETSEPTPEKETDQPQRKAEPKADKPYPEPKRDAPKAEGKPFEKKDAPKAAEKPEKEEAPKAEEKKEDKPVEKPASFQKGASVRVKSFAGYEGKVGTVQTVQENQSLGIRRNVVAFKDGTSRGFSDYDLEFSTGN